MRFCQADGTPLIDVVEDLDPYKTMVAKSEDIASVLASDPPKPPVPDEPVLELPAQHDANKTQVVSEEELRAEMEKAAPVIDIPSSPPPAPPAFSAPEPPPPPFAVSSTPSVPEPPKAEKAPEPPKPSPFGGDLTGDPFLHTTPPIPSPFSGKPDNIEPEVKVKPLVEEPASTPASPFSEPVAPATPFAEPASPASAANPFDAPSAEPFAPQASSSAEWTPPAAPVAGWQDQSIGENTPFQPPVAGTGVQSKTLAIVSLVLGILGLTLCCGTVLPSLVAIITGFMARGRASKDPANYGGAGLALGGLITGILGLLFSIAYLIFVFFFGGLQLIMQSQGGF